MTENKPQANDRRQLVAWVIGAEPSLQEGMLLVDVACPLCGGCHTHGDTGESYASDTMGHRVAHCRVTIDGYYGYTLRRAHEGFVELFQAGRQCTALTAKGVRCKARNIPRNGEPLCPRHAERAFYAATAGAMRRIVGPFYQDGATVTPPRADKLGAQK